MSTKAESDRQSATSRGTLSAGSGGNFGRMLHFLSHAREMQLSTIRS